MACWVAMNMAIQVGSVVEAPDRVGTAAPWDEGGWMTGRALYAEVAQSLRDGIARGEHPTGSRLPSESELAESFGMSHAAARQRLGRALTRARRAFVAEGQSQTVSATRFC